jgi:hypothetical protein
VLQWRRFPRRAKTEGREKERAGAAVTGSRGGGATPELEAVLPKEEGDDDRVWRERERKERRAGCRRLSTRDKEEGWGKGGPVRGGCKKGRGPGGAGTWRLVELRRRRGGGGPAVGTDPTPTEIGGVSHMGAGEGEGKAGRWADLCINSVCK